VKLTSSDQPDTKLDLVLQRNIDLPPELVWLAWTDPVYVKQWLSPIAGRGWSTVDCQIDLRPGGVFRTLSRAPDGRQVLQLGCYLEIVENERLVWTNALAPQAPSPRSAVEPVFTAMLSFEPHGFGTQYRAVVLHGSEAEREQHEALGFHETWSRSLDQLVATMTKHTTRTQHDSRLRAHG
jgi:uncharacterized protein YndB with AHSA1/START domain